MKTKPKKARTWVAWVGFSDGKPAYGYDSRYESVTHYDVFRTRTAASAVYEDVRRVVMTECKPPKSLPGAWRILIR